MVRHVARAPEVYLLLLGHKQALLQPAFDPTCSAASPASYCSSGCSAGAQCVAVTGVVN